MFNTEGHELSLAFGVQAIELRESLCLFMHVNKQIIVRSYKVELKRFFQILKEILFDFLKLFGFSVFRSMMAPRKAKAKEAEGDLEVENAETEVPASGDQEEETGNEDPSPGHFKDGGGRRGVGRTRSVVG
jgi:hypothetical protein